MTARSRELTAVEYAVLESCPQFDTCNCQDCPLDAMNGLRVVWPGERKCTARRSTRLRLGTLLPRKGLTRREFAQVTRFYGSVDAYLEHRALKVSEKGAIA
jgi:hypothetical protein